MAISDEIAVFCGNVKILREQHGLTKSEMARIMGVSPASLRRIEAGELPKHLSAGVALRLAGLFGLEPYQLFLPLR